MTDLSILQSSKGKRIIGVDIVRGPEQRVSIGQVQEARSELVESLADWSMVPTEQMDYILALAHSTSEAPF